MESELTISPKPLPDCAIFLLAKAYQMAHGRFQEMLRPYALTNLQHLVLEGLWYTEGQTAAELGKLLVLDKATLSGVLDRMREAGWLTKRPDPQDRRVVRLFTTPKAEERKEELITLRRKANAQLLAGFSLEEQVLLKRLLKDLAGVQCEIG
jgi:DNA-binding MarR family transcriptional regulator